MATTSEKPNCSTSQEEEEEEYVVEKIMNHRFRRGKLEYFLKWKGFSDVDNTWEPAENLSCPELVEAYESEKDKDKKANTVKVKSVKTPSEEKNTEEKKGKKRKATSDESLSKEKKKVDKQNGFDKGLTAEEIIGAMENNGEVHFLIKWKEPAHDYELIPSRIVNIKVPQMVIAFYEARLTWSTSSNSHIDDTDEPEEAPVKNGVSESAEKVPEETPVLNGGEEHT